MRNKAADSNTRFIANDELGEGKEERERERERKKSERKRAEGI